MFAAWRVSHFAWRALRLEDGSAQLVALLGGPLQQARSHATVHEVCPQALRAGVLPGMSMAEAQMRLPKLHWLNRDEAAEAVLQQRLFALADEFSPLVESTAPGVLLLDLRARHWGDERSWQERAQQMRQRMTAVMGFEIEVGMAETPVLALLAARFAQGVLVLSSQREQLQAFLHEIPLQLLIGDAMVLERLHSWGLLRLGQIASLPRQQWVRRMGQQGMALYELAQGGGMRLLELVVQQQRHFRRVELPLALETLPQLMQHLQPVLQALVQQVALLWLLAGAVRLVLHLANKGCRTWCWNLAEPTLSLRVIERLIEAGLQGVRTDAALLGFELELLPVARSDRQQDWLLQQSAAPAGLARVLSALEALLGNGRVGRATSDECARPGEVSVQNFMLSQAPRVSVHAGLRHGDEGLPLQRLRPRERVELQWGRQGTPVAMLRRRRLLKLRDCAGPWELSGLWWDDRQAWRLQCWDLCLEEGWLCQVGGDGEQWWLEGIYG
jgi:protein ImuB